MVPLLLLALATFFQLSLWTRTYESGINEALVVFVIVLFTVGWVIATRSMRGNRRVSSARPAGGLAAACAAGLAVVALAVVSPIKSPLPFVLAAAGLAALLVWHAAHGGPDETQ